MEFNGSVCTKSFSTNNQDEKLEAMELLDECWFFENLLHRRARMMTRSCSDPYPDSSKNMDEIFFETQEAKKNSTNPMLISSKEKEKEEDSMVVIRSNLLRTPSLPPPSINRDMDKEFIRKSPSKLIRQSSSLTSSSIINNEDLSRLLASSSVDDSYLSSKSIEEETFLDTQNAKKFSPPPTFINSSKEVSSFVRHNSLLRAPSLPPSLGGGGGEEKESTRKSSSKLTRRLSLCSADADALPPPTRVPKNLNQSITPGIPRHRAARRESRAENNVTKDREVIRRSLSFKKSSSNLNVNDLEVEEVQGFKDLGFVFDKDDVNKSLANIIPGLQDKKKPIVIDNENKARRPYLSEAWLLHSSSIPVPPPPPPPPAVPKWVERKSAGDMKAQLKYWARTVASNVRQEC